MKINNVQNNTYYSFKRGNKASKFQNNTAPSFKGYGSVGALVKFWDAVARGGFAASFTVQDMTGTNFPRTIQALNRNREITHELNYKAASEVFVREFLTGPSMCLIPMFVLGTAKKISGSSNEVPMLHIAPFSDRMKEALMDTAKKVPAQNREFPIAAKRKFYEKMFSLALGKDSDQSIANEASKALADKLIEYDKAPKRNLFKQLLDKKMTTKITELDGSTTIKGIKAKDQLFSEIVSDFSVYRKNLTTDYSDILLSDLSGMIKSKKSISSLLKDFSNFGCDVEKTLLKNLTKTGSNYRLINVFESFMDNFKNNRTASKFLTNILMVTATALFMVNIPKLYTIYETNPETDAFRNDDGEVIRANK